MKSTKNHNSEDLFSRNWLFISNETQDKIKTAKILLCGVGLGSYLAEALVRTGFQNLILADGDVVNRSNLNRQAFTQLDINKNKAVSIKKRLMEINKNCSIEVIEKYLNKKDLEVLIPKADYVVNTIDFDHESFVHCNDLCKKFNKIELFPTNIGFGGSVIVSTRESPSFSSFFKETDRQKLKDLIIKHLVESASLEVKAYIAEYYESPIVYDPQLAISSFITAAILATFIVKMIQGSSVKAFPDFTYVDLENIIKM